MAKARLADAVVLEAVATQARKAASTHQAALAPGEYQAVDGHLRATVRQKGKSPKAVLYVFSGPVTVTAATPSTRKPSLMQLAAVVLPRLSAAHRRQIERALQAEALAEITKQQLDEADVWLKQFGVSVPGKKPRVSAAGMKFGPAE